MDASLSAAFGLGLLLGIQHALDPDHLIAVSTIVSEHKNFKWASLIGAFWGLGHTTTLFIVGMVHGLAGNAALMLLVLSTIESPLGGLVYIVIFGLGSVGGMLLLSGIISLAFVLTVQRFGSFNRWIRVAAGIASVGLGWEIGTDLGWL